MSRICEIDLTVQELVDPTTSDVFAAFGGGGDDSVVSISCCCCCCSS